MKKELLSLSLVITMAFNIFMLIPIETFMVSAETGTSFEYDGYTVNYEIISSWNNGQNNNVTVTITNTGTETIENWMLAYDFMGTATMQSGGTIFEEDGITYVKNTGTNLAGYGDSININSGMSVNFSYSLTNPTGTPDSFTLCQERVSLEQGVDYAVTLNPQWDYGTSFQGQILLENLTDKPIECWELIFSSANFTLQNSWERTLIDLGNGRYTIKPIAGNIVRIAPNSTLTLGFQANKNPNLVFSDLEIVFEGLTEIVFGGIDEDDFGEPPIPEEMDFMVAFGEFDMEENSIILEWFYRDNIGDFYIYETSNTKELIAEVTDDSIYYFEVDNTVEEYTFIVENNILVSNEVIMRADGNGSYEFIIETDNSVIANIYDNDVTDLQILNLDEYYPLEIQFNDDETQIMSISGKFSEIAVKSPADAIYSIYSVKTLLGLDVPEEQLKFEKFNYSKSGLTYTFVQYYDGIEVFGSSITVSIDTAGKTVSLGSTVIDNDIISNSISTTPALSLDDINVILQTEYPTASIDYMVPVIYSGEYAVNLQLAYIAIIVDSDDISTTVIIDANTGDILEEYLNINNGMTTGKGDSETETDVSFPVNEQVVEYHGELSDSNELMFTPKIVSYTMEDANRKIYIYDSSNKDSKYKNTVNLFEDPVWFTWSDSTAISAYTNVITAYDWWKSKFSYKGLTGNGKDVKVYVHDPKYTDNAFYKPSNKTLHFCDKSLLPISGAALLDWVGHEYTHAVVDKKTSWTFNGKKPDTINEAYADIFGSFIDNDNWCTFPNIADPNNPITDPSDPMSIFATRFPSFVGGLYFDSNYVDEHTNSTIISHAAYKMEQSGISFDKLHVLWYDSLAEGYNSKSDFYTVRTNVIKSARKNNFSLSEITKIKKAFDDVGIFEDKGSVKITVLNGKEKVDSAKVTLYNYDTKKTAYITSANVLYL